MITNEFLLVGSRFDLTDDYLYAIKKCMEIRAIARIKEDFKSYDDECPVSKKTLRKYQIAPDYVYFKCARTEFIYRLEKGIDSRDRQASGTRIHSPDVVNKLNKELDKYILFRSSN